MTQTAMAIRPPVQPIVNTVVTPVRAILTQNSCPNPSPSDRILVVNTPGLAGDGTTLTSVNAPPRVRELVEQVTGAPLQKARAEWCLSTQTLTHHFLGIDPNGPPQTPTLPKLIISTGKIKQRDPMGGGMTFDCVEELKALGKEFKIPLIFLAPEDLKALCDQR